MSGRAITPTPEFVGNSRVRGAVSRTHTGESDHPLPRHRLHQSKAPKSGTGLSQSKAEKCAARTFAEQSGEAPAGLSQSKAEKFPPDFRRAK